VVTRAACLDELAAAIVAVQLDHPTRVAIDGVDGAGKTTLADELVDPIRRAGREVIRGSVDGFHNPQAVRYTRGSDSPDGYFLDSFDYAALRRELLEPLGPTGQRSFRTAVFDYRSDRAVETPLRSEPSFAMRGTAESIPEKCVISTRAVTFQGSAYTLIRPDQVNGPISC